MPVLLYAYPLGHRVHAELEIPEKYERRHTKQSAGVRSVVGSLMQSSFLPWGAAMGGPGCNATAQLERAVRGHTT